MAPRAVLGTGGVMVDYLDDVIAGAFGFQQRASHQWARQFTPNANNSSELFDHDGQREDGDDDGVATDNEGEVLKSFETSPAMWQTDSLPGASRPQEANHAALDSSESTSADSKAYRRESGPLIQTNQFKQEQSVHALEMEWDRRLRPEHNASSQVGDAVDKSADKAHAKGIGTNRSDEYGLPSRLLSALVPGCEPIDGHRDGMPIEPEGSRHAQGERLDNAIVSQASASVQVTIGRIVVSVSPQSQERAASARRHPGPLRPAKSLDQYLQRRSTGRS